jgi:hypothetical protein
VTVDVVPITDADVAAVGSFLHDHLNNRISPSLWPRVISGSRKADSPNHGFALRDGERVVGAYVAYYSKRIVTGRVERICNLGVWSVLPEYRIHSVRLLKALLAQDGYHFTDLSPNETVELVNSRLRFRYLDTSVALVPNLPWPALSHRTRISDDTGTIDSTLTGRELELYRDHAEAAAAHHLVLTRGSESCYIMFRRRWYRGRPIFASVIYISNPRLFRRTVPLLARHLLVHYRLIATFAELRIVGTRPRASFVLPLPKEPVRRHNSKFPRSYAERYREMFPPKMYRSATLEPYEIDDLYSELPFSPDW